MARPGRGKRRLRALGHRRADGRRLPCPRWGTITCTEHIASNEQFVAWYLDTHGAAPGESEEGFWIRGPGEAEPALVRDFESFFEAGPEVTEAVSVAQLSDVVTRLEGPNGAEAARRLVAIRRREARDRIEDVLHDGEARARAVLAEQVVADDTAYSRELCAALVYQRADAELARLILASWPSGTDLAPVESAARWSPDEGVRKEAAKVLARELSGFERRGAAREVLAR